MFEFGNNPLQQYLAYTCCAAENSHSRRYNTAISQFKWMVFCGQLARLLHRARALLDLNTVRRSLVLRGSSAAGVKTVEVAKIVGSEGRADDFDAGFHPSSDRARERWVSVAMAHLCRQPLPPVELIQVGEAYFVRDGHHRISVARAFGQMFIEAEVITWNVPPPYPWEKAAALAHVPSTRALSPRYRKDIPHGNL